MKLSTKGRYAMVALTEALARDLELSEVEIDEFWSFVKKSSARSRRPTRRGWASGGGA